MIDKNKEYRTRDGKEAIIYSTCGSKPYVVHGAYKTVSGWIACEWTAEGRQGDGGHEYINDLIEVKPRINRSVYLNVYQGLVQAHGSREDADASAAQQRLACIKVEINCEEGEGL